MAATDLGTVHLYGISGTVSNATVQDVSFGDELANKAKTEDENGNVIERRSDDLTTEGTITIKIRSGYTIPAPGATFTYETIKYEITKVQRVQKNKDFRMVTLNFVTSAGVNIP